MLISEARSREIDGLWLAEPGQFLYDPLPRARAYLDRFPPPDAGILKVDDDDQAHAGKARQEKLSGCQSAASG